MRYSSRQINETKAVRVSGKLAQTLKRFNIISKEWSGQFRDHNYIFKAAVREIRDAEDKEINVITTINGVNASEYSSYS